MGSSKPQEAVGMHQGLGSRLGTCSSFLKIG